MEEEPSFVCGNCNTKAPLRLKSCPNCKANFNFVVCSNCTHKGLESDFIKGCPVCGYMSPEQEALHSSKRERRGFFLKDLHIGGLALTATFFIVLMLTLLWFYDKLVHPLLP